MNRLHQLVAERGHLVIDGAMGTQLFAEGLAAGDAPERLNLDHPETVIGVHRRYIEAGSDIVLTNSFGGTRQRLKLHHLDDRVREISAAAARHARAAADESDRTVLVAGSMGPTGELIEPLGMLTAAEARASFAEQAAGLAEGGADLIWCETLSDLAEVEAAVLGAHDACDLPVVVTLSFDTAGRTMMGVTAADAVARIVPLGVAALGANCGNNIGDTESVVCEMSALLGDGEVLVVTKANAGIPVWHGTELHYNASPEDMAAHAHRVREAGVSIIGGCCGTTPAHISLIADVLAGIKPVPEVSAPGRSEAALASEAATSGDRPARRSRRR